MPKGYRLGHMDIDGPQQDVSHKAPNSAPVGECGAGLPACVGHFQSHKG